MNSVENLETASRIIATICERFKVTPAELESHCRAWRVVYVRWLAINLIRSFTDFSLTAIGVLFDRDKTTVSNSITGLDDEIATNPKAKADWESLCALFKAKNSKS